MTATTNLIINPSFETNASNWTSSGLDTCIRVTTDSRYGSCCLYIADTVTGAAEYVNSNVMAVTAGLTYSASAWVRRSIIAAPSYTGNMSISWFTAAWATISETTYDLPPGTFAWTRVTLTGVAPPTAAFAQIYFGDAGITAGYWNMSIDGVQFEQQPAATAYCDGDQPGCSWSGTAHASESSRAAESAYTTITITDGTTTLSLTDGRNYALVDQGWAPTVAPLRVSTLGGSSSYEDVEERITLNVLGETGVEALFNLAELSRMLDQAERWRRGEPVSAVKLTYQPQGSTLAAALQCVILGRSGSSAVVNSTTFNDLLLCYEISNVQISFLRRGLWLNPTAETAASSAVNSEAVATCTLASALKVPGPTSLTIASTVALASGGIYGAVIVAPSASAIQIVEAEGMTATNFTSVADSAHYARGDNVLRFTPPDTARYASGTISIDSLPATASLIGVWAAVRNNSATVDFKIQAALAITDVAVTVLQVYVGQIVPIDTSSTTPRLLFLGEFAIPPGASGTTRLLEVLCSAISTSGSPTLDIDYLCAVDLASAQIVTPNIPTLGWEPKQLQIQARALTALEPGVIAGATAFAPISYRGNAYLSTNTNTVAVCWLQPYSTYWRLLKDDVSGLASLTVTASRLNAYLTPQ